MRTSTTHPLQIATIEQAPGLGMIGITFCPGKKQHDAATGAWERDLDLDLDVIAEWNAAAVLTLIEEQEMHALGVPNFGHAVRDHHMAWYHLPIRDVSVPAASFEVAWQEVGEELRALLRSGAHVLVHCKGGLGRAGMIASRLAIELAMPVDEAITKVRSVRPGAIETAAQFAYVQQCVTVAERAPDSSRFAQRNRAIGALLGLAVGDALGTTLEFKERDSYPRLTDMVGGGPFNLKAGEWTDDMTMALALADSLNAHPHLDERDLMDRFVSWYETGAYSCTGHCFDIGITTRQALQRFKADGNPAAGSTDPRSAGNGSLMRLSPVAIRHWQDKDSLSDIAARQSWTTHGAAEAVGACSAFANILADVIAGNTRSMVLRSRTNPWPPAIAAIMAGDWRGKHRDQVRSSGYVVHSLEAALWCVGRTGNFADAVLLAANLGDDADTVAAITGQLAGALYGASGIPADWLARLAWRERIEAVAGRLFDAGDGTI